MPASCDLPCVIACLSYVGLGLCYKLIFSAHAHSCLARHFRDQQFAGITGSKLVATAARNITPFKAPHEHVGLNWDFSPGICLLLGAATARQKRQTAARANLNKPALPASFLLLATPPSKLLSRKNRECWKRKTWQFLSVSRQRYLAIPQQSEGKPHCPTACLSSSTARLENWTRHQFFVLAGKSC